MLGGVALTSTIFATSFAFFFPVQALATFRQMVVCSKRVKLLNPLFMSTDCELEKSKTILISNYLVNR